MINVQCPKIVISWNNDAVLSAQVQAAGQVV
jgi:hypothetical protein